MKKFLMVLMAVFAFSIVSIVSTENGSVDNGNLDGNWMDEQGYQEGSPAHQSLEAQVALYDSAKADKDTEACEKYAIRSWVKGWYAAELDRKAFVAGDMVKAKKDLLRAKAYGVVAQKLKSGRGEVVGKDDSENAPKFGGTSKREGIRVVAFAEKWLAKIPDSK